ncbi:Nbr1 FW domain-containing protein [Entamoeba marina]
MSSTVFTKTFTVTIDFVNVEIHRLIIDQTIYTLSHLKQKIAKIFRLIPSPCYIHYELPNHFVKCLNSNDDFLEFVELAEDPTLLHLTNSSYFSLDLSQAFTYCVHQVLYSKIQQQNLSFCPSELDSVIQQKKFVQSCEELLNSFLTITNSPSCSVSSSSSSESSSQVFPRQDKVQYQMNFLKHVTFVRKPTVHLNEKHIKVWRIKNVGNHKWPKGCYVGYWSGSEVQPKKGSFCVPQIIGAKIIEIGIEFEALEKGDDLTNFRLFTPDGIAFGDILSAEYIVN